MCIYVCVFTAKISKYANPVEYYAILFNGFQMQYCLMDFRHTHTHMS